MRQKNTTGSIWLKYTLSFCVLAFIVLTPVWFSGHTILWKNDSTQQCYPFMIYIGRWLRNAVSALLSGGSIPTFDLSIGFGADVIVSMNYYGLGDPLLLIAAILPESLSLFGYTFLAILRMYLAGAALLMLLKRFDCIGRSALLGALAYALSSFILYAAVLRISFFANPLIQLPLLILGLEKIFKRESPTVLILSTAYLALCGFYFLYMCSLFLLLYALVRHFTMGHVQPWRQLPGVAGRAIGAYVIGLCLAAPLLLPACLGFLNSARSGASAFNPMMGASLDYYLSLPRTFLAGNGYGLTMPALLLAACVFVPSPAKEKKLRHALLLLAVICLLIPSVGYFFNGFSYVDTIRWSFVLALLIAVCGARSLDGLSILSIGRQRAYALFTALYVLFLLVEQFLNGGSLLRLAYAIVCTIGSCCIVLLINAKAWKSLRTPVRTGNRVLALVLVVNVLCNALFVVGGYLSDSSLTSLEELEKRLAPPAITASIASSEEFARIDRTFSANRYVNDGLLADTPSTVYFNSIIPASIFDSFYELQLSNQYHLCKLLGLDSRATLESLWSAKYFLRTQGESIAPPYGATCIAEDEEYQLYQFDYALPLGWTTDTYFLREAYEQLPAVEKQYALLQGVVLDDPNSRYTQISLTQTAQSIPYTLTSVKDIDCNLNLLQEGGTLVAQKGSSLTLSFTGLPNSETYLIFKGFCPSNVLRTTLIQSTLSDGQHTTTMQVATPAHSQGVDQPDIAVNLGYSEIARTEITISFDTAFTAELAAIEVVCQPMNDFASRIDVLRAESLTDVELKPNQISGKVKLSKDKIMVFSVPYSKGWIAHVDGTPTEVLCADTAFLAVNLTAGEHDVVLTYRTPGLLLGLCLCLCGIVGWSLLSFYRRKKPQSL